jgi:membrane-associated protein
MTLSSLIDIVLHLNLYVGTLLDQYGSIMYPVLMLIIFAETGLVITPFLPGDSLLFATGLAVSTSTHNIFILVILTILSAFLGDNTNYWIGRFFGRKLFVAYPRIFKWEYLEKTEHFYGKYGPTAIILARFVPLMRTFIPFFAGLSQMYYARYLFFSLMSASLWVCLLTLSGYYFGNVPFVQNHFSLVILGLIIVSLAPTFCALLAQLRKKGA